MHDYYEFIDYNPIILKNKEKIEIEQMMSKAYRHFSVIATEKYGFSNIKKLRKECRIVGNDLLAPYPEAKEMMNWMLENEKRIVSAYIVIARKLCISFSKIKENYSSASFSDLVQESAMTIYDAMYQYNGSANFSTYVWHSIKHSLINFTRKNQRENGFGTSVLILRKKVRKLIKDGMTKKQAIKHIQDNDVRIEPALLERLIASLSFFQDVEDLELISDNVASSKSNSMLHAIECTPLSAIERDLMDAYLRRDNSYRNNLINPKTGKIWTKQRLSQIFTVACEKVKKVFKIQEKLAV